MMQSTQAAEAEFDSILALTQYFHGRLAEVFALHQELLLCAQFEAAELSFESFVSFLNLHMEHEERVLFIAHDTLAEHGEPLRWPAKIYRAEHDKLRAMINRQRQQIKQLLAMSEASASELRRQIITVIEYQRVFKNVLEHHEEREEMALLLELDRHLQPQVTKRFIAELFEYWQDSDQLMTAAINQSLALL